jgi:acyl-CoA synthetase (AMP-forming)/AMP-acid ligase II
VRVPSWTPAYGPAIGSRCSPRPRLEFLIVLLALHRIGAVWVGLNPRHRLVELDHVVKDTAPRLLLGIERFEGRDYEQDLRELARRNELPAAPVIIGGEQPDPRFYEILRTRDVQVEELAQAARAVGPGSLSCIVYTSGSTGQPKGAMLSRHGQLRAYEHWLSYVGTGPIPHDQRFAGRPRRGASTQLRIADGRRHRRVYESFSIRMSCCGVSSASASPCGPAN